MAEPSVASFTPGTLPNLDDNKVNQASFIISGAHDASTTTITTTTTISGITAPQYLGNKRTGELIYAEGISGATFTSCTRGADGTTNTTMADGDILVPIHTANEWNQLVRELDAIATYLFSQREKLTAARTYYVRTDGNDANDGLTDSAGGAFLTIQAAVNAVALLDINAQTVTIQVRDGVYGETITLKNVVGFAVAGNLVLQGNSVTPTNVSTATVSAFGLNVIWTIKDMQLTTQLWASRGSVIYFSGIDFSGGVQQIRADDCGVIYCEGNYTISGSAIMHMASVSGGVIRIQSKTITISGTLTFTMFADAAYLSSIIANGNTYTIVDSVTGKRYNVTLNSVLYTAGGANYFPGDVAGETSTGGQYL